MTHICVGNLTIIGSDNGLLPGRCQAIIRTNAGILLIGPLGTNFSEIQIEVLTFSFKKMRLNMSSVTWRPFCLSLNVLYEPCAYSLDMYCIHPLKTKDCWFDNIVCHHRWHCKLSLQKLTLPPVMTMLSKWWPFVFSMWTYGLSCINSLISAYIFRCLSN